MLLINEWYNHFKNRWTSVESNKDLTQQKETIKKVWQFWWKITKWQLERMKEMGILFGSVQIILIDNFCIYHISAKFLSRLCTPNQNKSNTSVTCNKLDYNINPDFINSWVYSYDPVTKNSHLNGKYHRRHNNHEAI